MACNRAMLREIRLVILFGLFGSLELSTTTAQAFPFDKRQETKAGSRWTLSDWFVQKRSMRAMDLWLGFHKPNPYEFYLGGTYRSGLNADAYFQDLGFHAAAFGYFMGASWRREWEGAAARDSGLLHMRLFGVYQQATHITLEGGAKHEVRSGVTLWNPIFGVEAAIYWARIVGIEFHYQHYFPAIVPALGGTLSGNRYEAAAFLEFKWIRIFGGYFYEAEDNSSLPQVIKSGYLGGVRLYF